MPVRQREKVQKMLRTVAGSQKSAVSILTVLLICSSGTFAAIFPDQLGDFKKGPVTTVSVADQALYREYGLDATEQSEYSAPGHRQMTATAWRMRDTTGAMALFDARRPPGAVPMNGVKFGARASDGMLFVYGNYVFQLTGDVPDLNVVESLYNGLAKLDSSPLPPLISDLPPEDLIANSERYIIGPVSLDRFEPRIPPSVAAFHLSAEAILGKYSTAKGPLTLLVFHYPTPNIARERTAELQKIPGAVARRVGVLVAVTIAPPDQDEAERILSRVRYDTNLTLNEPAPGVEVRDKVRFILNVFVFAGLLILVCLAAGFGFGGYRALRRKLRHGDDPDAMITLHLSE